MRVREARTRVARGVAVGGHKRADLFQMGGLETIFEKGARRWHVPLVRSRARRGYAQSLGRRFNAPVLLAATARDRSRHVSLCTFGSAGQHLDGC